MKDPVPIVQEAGWAPGPVRIGAENLAPNRIRSPDLPASSQSLYQLSYRAHSQYKTPLKLVYMFLRTPHKINLLTDKMTVFERGTEEIIWSYVGEWGEKGCDKKGRILHNEELHKLHCLSPGTIWVVSAKSVRWAWNVAGMGRMRIEYKVAVGKSEGKRPPGRRGRGW